MDANLFFQQLINGLALGTTYSIFALGYTLIFSILGIINFAHGAVFTLGAYFTYLLMGLKFGFNGILAQQQLPFGLPFPVAVFLSAILCGFMSVFIEQVAFRPLRNRGADPLLTLVSSLGVTIVIVNVIQYLVGAEAISYPTLTTLMGIPDALRIAAERPLIIRTSQLVTFGVSAIILVVLTYLINYTKMGKALQAVAEDQITSNLLGINTNRLIFFTFFLSGFVAGIAGSMVGLGTQVDPYFGVKFGLKGLAVIVLGGLGSIPGAVIGGMVIGLSEAFVPASLVGWKNAIAFFILFLVLLFRPRGLLGRVTITKV